MNIPTSVNFHRWTSPIRSLCILTTIHFFLWTLLRSSAMAVPTRVEEWFQPLSSFFFWKKHWTKNMEKHIEIMWDMDKCIILGHWTDKIRINMGYHWYHSASWENGVGYGRYGERNPRESRGTFHIWSLKKAAGGSLRLGQKEQPVMATLATMAMLHGGKWF